MNFNKTELCKCTNCENILFDENPQCDAIKYEITGNELHMIQCKDDSIHWACPICKTDSFLIDL